MKKYNLSYDEALKLVKKSRTIVNLNVGFVSQLRVWERKLRESRKLDEPLSAKSPVEEINVNGVIDYVDQKE